MRNDQKSIQIVQTALVAVFSIVLVLAIILAVRTINRHHADRSFSSLLVAADTATRGGDRNGARAKISSAVRYAATASQWLSLYRRALALSENNPAADLPSGIIRRAATELPASNPVRFVQAWSLLRSGSAPAAAAIARRYLDGAAYAGLRVEAELQARMAEPGATSDATSGSNTVQRGQPATATSGGLELFAALTPKSPPQLFRDAAQFSGDSRFLLDALLIEARSSTVDAYRAAQGTSLTEAYPAVVALLGYDAGDFDAARSEIAKISDDANSAIFNYLQADMAMAERDYSSAYRWYETLRAQAPGYDQSLYINLAWLSAQGKIPPADSPAPGAVDFLRLGYGRFGDKSETVRAYANLLVTEDNLPEARRIVAKYLAEHPDDARISLYQLLNFSTQKNATRLLAGLWQLANQFPDSGPVIQELSSRLLAVRDFHGLTDLRSRYGADPPGNLAYFEAISDAVSGNIDQAKSLFDTLTKSSSDWQAYYDLGLADVASRSNGPAGNALSDARAVYLGQSALLGSWAQLESERDAPEGGRLFYYLAVSELAAGDVSAAYDDAQRATSLAPNFPSAEVLLERLRAAVVPSRQR